MADADVLITQGSGTKIDTRTVGASTDEHRQVMVIGDPSTAAGVAPVSATNGLSVSVVQAAPPHNIGLSLVSKTVQLTSSSTGTTIWTPTSGKRIAVYMVQIQAGGTTAGSVQVYFGASTYSRGTNYALFDGEFAPSSTLKPGVVITPALPFLSITATTDLLRVASSAAINPLTVTAWLYEF